MVFKIFLALVTIYVLIYTISYGVWEAKHKNILGATAVFVLCTAVIVLPIITVLIFL